MLAKNLIYTAQTQLCSPAGDRVISKFRRNGRNMKELPGTLKTQREPAVTDLGLKTKRVLSPSATMKSSQSRLNQKQVEISTAYSSTGQNRA